MSGRKRMSLRYWFLSFLLITPALIPYLTHYFIGIDGLVPTGFIHEDWVYYMANGREFFDEGFHLSYGNPFGPSYDMPRIYFQPLMLLLGTVWRVTGWDPGVVFVLVGFVAAVVCARVAIALYREVIGLESWAQRLGLVTFFWGGGVLAIAGFVYNVVTHEPLIRVFRFEPEAGWWFLNFGRNLILPTEATYHALFFACILFVLRNQYRAAALFALLLSISHPFTGLELLMILCVWSFVEVFLARGTNVPRGFLYTCCLLVALHVGYYLVFLNRFPEHRIVVEQWAQPWVLRPQNFIPAYLIVGALAFLELRRIDRLHAFLALPRNRLFLLWFLVVFLLANHQIFIRPVQPVHFERGYIWTALFLIGGQQLIRLFAGLTRRRFGVLGMILFVAVFLSDNALWLGVFPVRTFKGIRLTEDQASLLNWMNSKENNGSVILAQHNLIGYLAPVYTSLRAWWCHPYITPYAKQRWDEQKSLFVEDKFLQQWDSLRLLVVFVGAMPDERKPQWLIDRAAERVWQSSSYTVFRINPRSAASEAFINR